MGRDEGNSTIDLEEQPTKRRRRSKGTDPNNKPFIANWSCEERMQLLEALKMYGPTDVARLAQAVPSKTIDKVRLFVNHSWKTARKTVVSILTREENLLPIPNNPDKEQNANSLTDNRLRSKYPLEQWLSFLEQAQPLNGYNEVKALPVAKSMLYIAKFENHPTPEESCGLDFKELYEFLYNMLRGHPSKRLSQVNAQFVLDTIRELGNSLSGPEYIKAKEFAESVREANYAGMGPGRQAKADKERVPETYEECMKMLQRHRGFNPLRVPVELLKVQYFQNNIHTYPVNANNVHPQEVMQNPTSQYRWGAEEPRI